MRIALITLGTALLITLVLGLWFLLSPKQQPIGYIQFPQAGDRVITREGDDIFYPDRGAGYREVDLPQETTDSAQGEEEEAPTGGFVASLSDFIARLVGRYRSSGSTSQAPGSAIPEDAGDVGVSYGGGSSIPFVLRGDDGTYSGPSPYYQYPDTDDGDDSGDSNGDLRDDVEFNPQTGDLWVGGVHFNFTGMQTVANGTTSDVVGDPDNLTLGTTIGSFVGALIGDPALGLLLGTALGSNLYNGFTLQDLGIGLDNGIPTFGGVNPLEEGGPFDHGNDRGSENGRSRCQTVTAEGTPAGSSCFAGFALTIPCTCSTGYYAVINVSEQYSGTYLITPNSRAYENYGTVGFYNIIGSYQEGTGSGQCEMYVGESCEEYEIDKGAIDTLPGYGTSEI